MPEETEIFQFSDDGGMGMMDSHTVPEYQSFIFQSMLKDKSGKM